MRTYIRRIVLAVVALVLVQGSLVTIHANSPHKCPRGVTPKGKYVEHMCEHGKKKEKDLTRTPLPEPVADTDSPVLTFDDEGPNLPPCPWDVNCQTCICPWDSWACFFASSSREQILSKGSLLQVIQHGPFNLW